MARRSRIAAYGCAGLLVLAGGVSGAVFSDGFAEILALVLISLGLVLATSLVFLEVGLSEDRERARERSAQRRAPTRPSRRQRLSRLRGRRRRL